MFWSTAFNPVSDLEDLTGKIIIVTGGNTGIGYGTVKHLAQKGAKVYLASRTEEKGREAISRLHAEGIGAGEVVLLHCDLSSPASAKRSAEKYMQLESRLDILISNAACTWDKTDKPAQDGISEMMMTNHIGTFQFTDTLLPLLVKTSEEPGSDVRIVTVASDGHRIGRANNPKIDFSNLDEFKNMYEKDTIPTMSRYFVSKLCNVLFSNALQRRLAATTIICMAVHPGTINTSASTRFWYPRVANFILSLLLKGPDEGAYTSCFAAASPTVRSSPEIYKGAYLEPVGHITQPTEIARREGLQDDLWKTTEEYLASLNM